jgi:hypothetical protein
MSLIARRLRPDRRASSSCVSPAADRYLRNAMPKRCPARTSSLTPGLTPSLRRGNSATKPHWPAVRSAAGYLPVLVLLPLLGTGLGAWGGLLATNPAGHRPGGNGGGGGSGGPAPPPVPPGGLRLGEGEDEDQDAGEPGGQRELVLV